MQSTMSQSSKMLADDSAGKAVVVDAETELPAVHRGLFAGAVVDADTELPVQHRMSVATRIIEAQRSTTLKSTAVVLLSMLFAGGAAISVIATRPIGTDSGRVGSTLVDSSGTTVETGLALHTESLVDMAQQGGSPRGRAVLDHLKSLHLPDHDTLNAQLVANRANMVAAPDSDVTPMRTVTVENWRWVNASWMSLSGTDGTMVLVSNGNVAVKGPPDGYAGFKTDLTRFKTDDRTDLAALEDNCNKHKCPLTHCSANTYHGRVMHLRCGSSTLWQWPTNVVLEEPQQHGRQLDWMQAMDACEATAAACRGKGYVSGGRIFRSGCYESTHGKPIAEFQTCIEACSDANRVCLEAVVIG